MNRPGIAAYTIIVVLLAAVCMFALNSALQPVAAPLRKVLIIGDGRTETWPSMTAGARAAALQFGLDVCFERPKPGDSCNDQSRLLSELDLSPFAGVAVSPVNPDTQCDQINDLAGRTNLVTFGKDCDKSRRLCHVGYYQNGTGRMVAHIVHQTLQPGDQIALLHISDTANSDVRERLEGFRAAWEEWDVGHPSGEVSIVEVLIDSRNETQASQDLARAVQNPRLATVIAFDQSASELVADTLAQTVHSNLPNVIAFEPTAKVLDAIESGRVSFTVYNDPYRQGYEVVERLSMYCTGDETALPVPGHGSSALFGEIVDKHNLAEFRRRTGRLPESARVTAAQARTSTLSLDVESLIPMTLGEILHLPFVASVFE